MFATPIVDRPTVAHGHAHRDVDVEQVRTSSMPDWRPGKPAPLFDSSCARPSPLRVVQSNSPPSSEPTNPSITNFNGKKTLPHHSSLTCVSASWRHVRLITLESYSTFSFFFSAARRNNVTFHRPCSSSSLCLSSRFLLRWHPTNRRIHSHFFSSSPTINNLYLPTATAHLWAFIASTVCRW